MQTKIPCILGRGGTSKGTYFMESDLPADAALRDRILLAVMGSPDERQIDGVGGANPLTSKVAVVKPSQREGIDVDYLFIQVFVDEAKTSTAQNCGNILAGVGPFAIEQGLAQAQDPETLVTVFMENTNSIAKLRVQTPNGKVNYEGDARIDGVPGTHSPIMIEFLDVAGSTCGALLPTGNVRDAIDGIPVTLIDNGMPVVVIAAESMDISGNESKDELEQNQELKQRVESIRLQAGPMMKLGDVRDQTVPKMALVSRAEQGGMINSRWFIPHRVHDSIGVFAAVSLAVAAAMPGSVAHPLAQVPAGRRKWCDIEHPSGLFTVEVELDDSVMPPVLHQASILRTARLLFEGNVLIPSSIWRG